MSRYVRPRARGVGGGGGGGSIACHELIKGLLIL